LIYALPLKSGSSMASLLHEANRIKQVNDSFC
jgi:hypothetical protein